MKIIKFGGKSLANGAGLNAVLDIISTKIRLDEKFILVLSARGNATDELEILLDKAQQNIDYKNLWRNFKTYQQEPCPQLDFQAEFNLLEKIFEGVRLVEDYSPKIKDLVLAQGELLAVKSVAFLLQQQGIQCLSVDSRNLLVTDSKFGSAHIIEDLSAKKTQEYFNNFPPGILPIVTGFIASDKKGNTTTLGRNGSNYSAALLAKYLNASEFQNYTHVDGIYTANPELVEDARILGHISYQEANELASFGASILHAKTIVPLLENNIPLRILNTFNTNSLGTLISNNTPNKGVKSISVQKDVSIINLEGKGLLGKTGIDARIFNTLGRENINIGVVSQGSSERGVGLVVSQADSGKAVQALKQEFANELKENDISTISAIPQISVVSLIGESLNGFSSALQSLVKNDIEILLINNNIAGSNISLVIENNNVNKAVNTIHSQIFGVAKNINIAIFGKGNVGGSLINQILKSQSQILKRKEIRLNIFAVAGTQKILFAKHGVSEAWLSDYENSLIQHESVNQVIEFAKQHHLENLIAIDNTASNQLVDNYIPLIEGGFDLISSNKIANTIDFGYYKKLRECLKQYHRQYLYETNVGAGLPLIDTIKLLHESGENITRIKGVFSGSLSYIFNNFSESDKKFSTIVKEAMAKGYTEPDPREDLCGNDVARKLLILARELDLENEMKDIQIKNLIPNELSSGNTENFLQKLEELDKPFDEIKQSQKENHVLRYVGDLHGDLQLSKGILDVSLVSVPKNSALGQLSGSNSIFEIFTDSYGENPIVIQGAGAGAEVTARGVFGDLLRVAEKK